MAKRSVAIILKARDEASRRFKTVGGGLKSLARKVFNLKTAIVGAFGALAVRAMVRSTLEAFGQQEEAVARLESVLRSTGQAAGFTSGQLQQMAKDLQSVTRFGDETIINAQAVMATFTQIRGDVFQHAIVAAMNMSETIGQDLKSSVIQLGKALNDPIKGISALQRVGVSFTAEQKEVIKALVETGRTADAQKMILSELNTEFGGMAERLGATASGRLKQFKNAMGDIKEEIGAALMPTIGRLTEIIQQNAGTVRDWIVGFINGFRRLMADLAPAWEFIVDTFRTIWVVGSTVFESLGNVIRTFSSSSDKDLGVVGTIAKWIAAVFKFMGRGLIVTFTAVETAVVNWRDMFSLAWVSIKLGAITWWRNMGQIFGVWVPQLLKWFGENWVDIFVTAANAIGTVLWNLWKNIKDNFWNIGKWIFSGDWLKGEGPELVWTGLLDGFKSTIKKLPTFFRRIIQEDEMQMRRDIQELGNKLGEDFRARLIPRLQMLEGGGAGPGKPGGALGKGVGGKALKFEFKPVKLDIAAKRAIADAIRDGARGRGRRGPDGLAAIEARFLRQAGRFGKSPAEKQVEEMRKNTAAVKSVAKETELTRQAISEYAAYIRAMMPKVANVN